VKEGIAEMCGYYFAAAVGIRYKVETVAMYYSNITGACVKKVITKRERLCPYMYTF